MCPFLLIKCLSVSHSPLLFPLCCAVQCDWPFLFLRAGSRRQVLSAAECCCVCVGSRGLVQHSSGGLIDTVPEGRRGGGQMPAPNSQKKNWRGKWNPLRMYLLWEDCDNILQVHFLSESLNSCLYNTPLPDLNSSFTAYLWGCKLV